MLGCEPGWVAQLLLMVVGLAGLAAYPPQILQLLRTKSSAGVSISSWIVWSANYATFAAYVFLYTSDRVLMMLYSIEMLLCVTTLWLILRFRFREGDI